MGSNYRSTRYFFSPPFYSCASTRFWKPECAGTARGTAKTYHFLPSRFLTRWYCCICCRYSWRAPWRVSADSESRSGSPWWVSRFQALSWLSALWGKWYSLAVRCACASAWSGGSFSPRTRSTLFRWSAVGSRKLSELRRTLRYRWNLQKKKYVIDDSRSCSYSHLDESEHTRMNFRLCDSWMRPNVP